MTDDGPARSQQPAPDGEERPKERKGTLAEFFARAPKFPEGFELPPREGGMREIDLWSATGGTR